MIHRDLGELESLIAKLSDGQISLAEKQRLNQLLEADPIAQEAYLDHFLIDGLLERELCGSVLDRPVAIEDTQAAVAPANLPAASRRRRARWSYGVVAASALVTAVGLAVWSGLREAQQVDEADSWQPLLIAHAGFESEANSAANPFAMGFYSEDIGGIVGRHAGVPAFEGRKMYRFIKPLAGVDETCDLLHFVDLRRLPATALGPDSHLEASAFFNAVDSQLDSYRFKLSLYAYQDAQVLKNALLSSEQPPVASSGCQILADRNLDTWQKVTTRIPLPPEARVLIVKLSVSGVSPEAEEEFAGAFADNVSLHLVKSL